MRNTTILLLILFFCTVSVYAFEGDMGFDLSTEHNAMIHSDLYLIGWNVEVNSEVDGDIFVLGATVHVRGPIHGNVYLAGGTVDVDAPVEGDVNVLALKTDSFGHSRASRLMALNVNHRGATTGDLLSLGLVVNTDGQVQGDTLIAGEIVTLEGTHRGDFYAYGHQVTINGAISGDSKVNGTLISIGSKGALKGNLEYNSSRDLTGNLSGVKGKIVHAFPGPGLPKGMHIPFFDLITRKLFSALWLSVVGFFSLTWFPRSSQNVVDTMLHEPWESFGAGVLVCIGLPATIFLLIVSLLGIPIGIFLALLFAVGVYLTRLFASLYIGERILQTLEHHFPPYWQSLPLGVLVFTMLTSIQYLGLFVSVVVIPLALGAKALLAWRYYQRVRRRPA